MNTKKLLFSVGVITVAISLYFIINTSSTEIKTPIINNEQIQVNVDENKISKFIKSVNKSKVTSQKETIKKIAYTKVALPDDIRDLEHDLVDIQNAIANDKYLLDNEAKELLANANMDDEIKKTDTLLAELNKKTNMPQEKIDEIENSYTVIMSTPVTSPSSVAIQNDLTSIDSKILDIEKDFEKLQNGDI